jgi:poly(hydroxyalkanoate) granule-associated protein
MLKKARAEAAGSDDSAKPTSQSVLSSSRQIWLAGLGAFSRAQQEGGKVFETLVKQGQELEAKTRTAAADTADAARDAAVAKAKEMQTVASGTWDKLEQVFEDRVAKALARLGFHTAADLERLVERVDALSQSVNALLASSDGKPTQSKQSRPRAQKGASEAVRPRAGRSGASRSRSGSADAKSSAGGSGIEAARPVVRKAVKRARS